MIKHVMRMMLATALLTVPNDALGEEIVTTVTEGQPAPFDGTLFNTEAAARLLTELQFTEQSCQIEIDRQLGLQEARLQFEIDKLNSVIDTSAALSTQRLEIRDEHIDLLTQDLVKQRKPNQTAWFATGVASGIALTVFSGWAIGQAAGN